MSDIRVPVLFEADTGLDWPGARYEVEVTIKGSQATVVHRLEGAPALTSLVDAGQAQWITELRCPRTMLSRQSRSTDSTQTVDWADHEVAGESFLVPGLVSDCEVALDPACLNRFAWDHSEKVIAPAGWWLVRGEARRVKPLVSSLVRFKENVRFDAGQMCAEEDNDGGTPYFRVEMAADLFGTIRRNRDVQVAGLIAACAHLPRSSMRQEAENEEHALAQLLRARFEAAGVPDWDSDQFDPARAATCLEPFLVLQQEEDEE